MKTIETPITRHRVVSREEWLKERVALLEREKAHTRERDEISRQRRELPWVKVEKQYVFEGPEGKVTLADLFDGRSQLFIKHFMMGPGQVGQCVGCSRFLDMIPKGRDGNGPYKTLADWVRPKNLYGQGGMVEANGRYHSGGCACGSHEP